MEFLIEREGDWPAKLIEEIEQLIVKNNFGNLFHFCFESNYFDGNCLSVRFESDSDSLFRRGYIHS